MVSHARRLSVVGIILAMLSFSAGDGNAGAAITHQPPWQPPPENENVMISNGGLSVEFNIAWGAVVVGIADKHVAHELNIVDFHDVGRELQVDEFLSHNAPGRQPLLINPTQAGALGHQAFAGHPHGVAVPETGSHVVRWKATRHTFFAVVRPLDYDTGNPTHWVYTEQVHIDRHGVAHFYYRFQRHGHQIFRMSTEIPTLYSDRTDAFMYPTLIPYGRNKRMGKSADAWRRHVRLVQGSPRWPGHNIISKGWIANIDTANRIGIFYTTPVGLPESFGCFRGASVSDRAPLGKSNVVGNHLICRPNEIYSIRFSVVVATPQNGPALISSQKPAELRINGKLWHPIQH